MTLEEFSNLFDVLYNNITSNQAPGLNEYEKSVFLTKALNELVKNYFTANSKGNNIQQGFDDSAKRQADFSVLMKTGKCNLIISGDFTDKCYKFIYPDGTTVIMNNISTTSAVTGLDTELPAGTYTATYIVGVWQKEGEEDVVGVYTDDFVSSLTPSDSWMEEQGGPTAIYQDISDAESDGWGYVYLNILQTSLGETLINIVGTGVPTSNCTLEVISIDSKIDPRSGVYSFPKDTFIIINESLFTTEGKILLVIPLRYDEYTRLMSKPFKRPLKNQAWRLINTGTVEGAGSNKYAEIVTNLGDEVGVYLVRYIRVPLPIILAPLDGLSIGGYKGKDSDSVLISADNITSLVTKGIDCELDPTMHEDILLRAVELAKVAWASDLEQLAATSTNITSGLRSE